VLLQVERKYRFFANTPRPERAAFLYDLGVLELIIWAKSLLFLFLVLWPSICLAWTGDVVGVADGDTITVLKDKTPVKIRLYGIDCPEKGGQAFGKKARQFTSKMVFRKLVEIKPVDKDRYGRTVAWVYVDGKNLCEELVINGLAWHYKRYSSDQKLADLENRARKGRVGLWSDPHAIPPWEGGFGLSVGEKQLLSFVRVLYREPMVLVLDEATASIDSETEKILEEAVAAGIENRTSIVIAHRLATIRRADRIVVIDDGTIKESGTHEKLMAKGAIYKQLVDLEMYHDIAQQSDLKNADQKLLNGKNQHIIISDAN
jgi:endonuclease YncB( thermonuclease family)